MGSLRRHFLGLTTLEVLPETLVTGESVKPLEQKNGKQKPADKPHQAQAQAEYSGRNQPPDTKLKFIKNSGPKREGYVSGKQPFAQRKRGGKRGTKHKKEAKQPVDVKSGKGHTEPKVKVLELKTSSSLREYAESKRYHFVTCLKERTDSKEIVFHVTNYFVYDLMPEDGECRDLEKRLSASLNVRSANFTTAREFVLRTRCPYIIVRDGHVVHQVIGQDGIFLILFDEDQGGRTHLSIGYVAHQRLYAPLRALIQVCHHHRQRISYTGQFVWPVALGRYHWDTCPVVRTGVWWKEVFKPRGDRGRDFRYNLTLWQRLKSYRDSKHSECHCNERVEPIRVVPLYQPELDRHHDLVGTCPNPRYGLVDDHMISYATRLSAPVHTDSSVLAAAMSAYVFARSAECKGPPARPELACNHDTDLVFAAYASNRSRNRQWNLDNLVKCGSISPIDVAARDSRSVFRVPELHYPDLPVRGRCNQCGIVFGSTTCHQCGRSADKRCARGHYCVCIRRHHICGVCDVQLPKGLSRAFPRMTRKSTEVARIYAANLVDHAGALLPGSNHYHPILPFSSFALDYVRDLDKIVGSMINGTLTPGSFIREGTTCALVEPFKLERKRGFTCCAYAFLTVFPTIAQPSMATSLIAVAGRQLPVTVPLNHVVVAEFFSWVRRFFYQIFPVTAEMMGGTQFTKAEEKLWLATFPLPVQKVLAGCIVRLNQGQLDRRDDTIESFIKHELSTQRTHKDHCRAMVASMQALEACRTTNDGLARLVAEELEAELTTDQAARNISSRVLRGQSAATGTVCCRWSKVIAHVNGPESMIFYACGANAITYGLWMEICLAQGFRFFSDGDAKRFDGHMTNDVSGDLCSLAYKRFGADRKSLFWRFHRSKRNQAGRFRVNVGGRRVTTIKWSDSTGSRASGDNDTTLGNSVVAHCVHAWAAATVLANGNKPCDFGLLVGRVRIALIGDDVVFAWKTPLTHLQEEALTKAYEPLGLEYEFHHTAEPNQVQFAGGYFMKGLVESKPTWCLVPDMKRWLPKFGTSRTAVDDPFAWIRGNAKGWRNLASTHPVMNAVVNRMNQLVGTGPCRKMDTKGTGKVNLHKVPKIEAIWEGPDRSTLQLARAYEVDESIIFQVCSDLANIPCVPCLIRSAAVDLMLRI